MTPFAEAQRIATPETHLPEDTPPVDADAARLQEFYRQMATIRATEQALLDLFAAGKLRGTVHTCLGQEACAVGVVSALDLDRDIVCSNHRGHGHYLAYSDDIRGLIAEVMGLPDGASGGIGGSQHLHNRNFYSNGILGGMSPVTAGMALAEMQKGSGAVACVFHGDGAMGEGAIYETLNLAALWKLPFLIAIEANEYAQSTPISMEQAGRLAERADAFGVPVRDVDGNDIEAVAEAASEAVAELRQGDGARMLYLRTYRMGPHSKGDDDRDPAEIEARRDGEPLARLRAALGNPVCDVLDAEAQSRVAAIVREVANG